MIGYKTITVLRDESSSIIEYSAVLLYTTLLCSLGGCEQIGKTYI